MAGVLAVAAATLVMVLPLRPDEVAARPVAAPSTVPASSGPAPSVSASGSIASDPGGSGPNAIGTATAASSTEPSATPTPKPGRSLAPGYTAMEALYADSRLPELPKKPDRLHLAKPGKRVYKDKRTGLAVPVLSSPWKAHKAAPFTSKQVLPLKRGSKLRGMFVTCPLPIEKQKSARDSALLAARWTLNHHPKHAKIRWLASQPVKRGWLLTYQVKYGKHVSRAAVVVVDGGMAKPGLAFVTVPDSQRTKWRDITRVVSGVRVLG
ncbi:hypothetical protein [Nonomuraea rhizosphaerae]|uniref:hypothetical protein n=1 Tax=Nonomuraea rhizosphaerae TaxID=2665663 RepID=UPI001C5FAF48|nr:hypothetical protein [Nonomuraea rhizosphaerae]